MKETAQRALTLLLHQKLRQDMKGHCSQIEQLTEEAKSRVRSLVFDR